MPQAETTHRRARSDDRKEPKAGTMLTQAQITEKGWELGFEDVGFTTADPFDTHKRLLQENADAYAWAEMVGLDLVNGTDPRAIMPTAKTIIVLMEVYFREAYPRSMEAHFGRCRKTPTRVSAPWRPGRLAGLAARRHDPPCWPHRRTIHNW